MLSPALDPPWVARYSRPPAKTTLARAISLHQNVRDLLGQGSYDTILQGSYKNDTALADMNDVDVLAICTDITKSGLGWFKSIVWEAVFANIETRLDSDPRYAGKWKRHDKCITLETGIHLDIVPAVAKEDPGRDPIVIHSFSANADRENCPRQHYENGAAKNGECNSNFKPAVRLFKRWARCHFPGRKVAPSYYLECLLFRLPNNLFSGDLAQDFVAIGKELLHRHDGRLGYGFQTLSRLDGEGNLFRSEEWPRGSFVEFLAELKASVRHAANALAQDSSDRAKATWRLAFDGFEP
jgi:hypothetical protein